MVTLNQEQIKEITEQLDCGFRAFYHKTTGDLVFIIDTRKFPEAEIDEADEDSEKLAKNPDDYLEVEAMESHDAFRVMEAFAEQLTDTKLQDKLFRALNKRGPFQEFRFVLDNAGDYLQQWYAFKNQQYIDWVAQQIEANQN
jgi:hypothetical protein